MRTMGRVGLRGWATSVLLLGIAISFPARAHEKWFTDSRNFPVNWADVLSLRTLLVVVAVGVGLVATYALDTLLRKVGTRTQRARVTHATQEFHPRGPALERLFAFVPLLVGLHAAAPLLVSGLQLQLFAANLNLPRNIFGGLMALAQITVALSFVYGALTRVFGLVLVALVPLGCLFFSPAYVLEHLDFAGVGIFMYILGRGPYSVDALIGTLSQPARPLVPYAVPALRVLTGAAIVVLGFTEKIWNEQLAQSFLAYQDFNFARSLGFTDELFILAAGVAEVLVGAVLISGKLTRLVIAVAWIPFNLTLPYLGWVELVGHFSIYGTMVVLLVWGPKADLSPYLQALSHGKSDEHSGKANAATVPSGEAAGPAA
ncbi:MAG: hypothetical protein M3506_03325 [Chloroflexota bacterium]|nr:hypothetical protein [Chloroflexota bacterium]